MYYNVFGERVSKRRFKQMCDAAKNRRELIAAGLTSPEQRLQKASKLLLDTRLSIKEVTAVVGYEHTSSFTRAFEQRFGQTPQVFRRNGARES